MTLTVSINQFRQHIADYIVKAKDGFTIILKDERKNQSIARFVGIKKFNPATFGKALKAASGVFTAEHHPEWRTKKDVIKWLEQSRKSSDRTF